MLNRQIMKNIRSAICTILLSASFLSAFGSDMLLPYSSSEPRLKEMGVPVAGRPSAHSRAVEKDVVGNWMRMPTVSKDLSLNPDLTWQSIRFHSNGVVEISYRLASEVQPRRFVGSYEVIHKAKAGRGNPPNIAIRAQKETDGNLNMLLNVRLGEFSYFPPDVPVLWFQDLDGYHYVFQPEDVSDGHRMKLLGRASAQAMDSVGQPSKRRSHQEARVPDAKLTEQSCAKLAGLDLSESERNKEIVLLMNKGDPASVPVLLDHLGTNHSLVVRQNAIRALGKVGDEQAVPKLLDILRTPVQGNIEDQAEDEAILRRNAVVALGDIGDTTALPVLKAVAASGSEYQTVRDLARITTMKIEGKLP